MKSFLIAFAIVLYCVFVRMTGEFFLSTALTVMGCVCLLGVVTVWRFMRYGCG
jgi:hypothetical protein